MKRLLFVVMALAALCFSVPASAATATFLSDHCNCGPQSGGFATITATDLGSGSISISIQMLNGNTFANGGQDVVFGFNLVGNPTITYSGLSASFSIPNVIPINQQAAGALSADGLGNFEYGIEGTFQGSNGPSSTSFTISAAGLTLASFAELSTIPPGDMPAFFALDIFSGTTGLTGFVDASAGPTPFSNPPEVPLPGAIWLFGSGMAGLWALSRRRKKSVPQETQVAPAT